MFYTIPTDEAKYYKTVAECSECKKLHAPTKKDESCNDAYSVLINCFGTYAECNRVKLAALKKAVVANGVSSGHSTLIHLSWK
jgi:hypothetical protein